jgi:hypothetical protein
LRGGLRPGKPALLERPFSALGSIHRGVELKAGFTMKLLFALFACGALSVVLFVMVKWMEEENDRSRTQLFSMMLSGH